MSTITTATTASAGVHDADGEVTYKEYWVPHSQFTGGCDTTTGGKYYLEPDPCVKTVTFSIPDNFANAYKAEIYLDLWRNHDELSLRYQINSGALRQANVGDDYSRTPFIGEIPKEELVQGSNTIAFTATNGLLYHVHDIAIRLYYTSGAPLIAGPGSDVTPPTGALTQISAGGQNFTPAAGGTLNVNANTATLSATASGAAYVEFHAYYDGFDEDNDGQTLDWHSFYRNNWNPGGTAAKSSGGTIGHIGTDATSPYAATWNLNLIPSQSGVKFKLRVVDSAGNVREAPGGVSAPFTLSRTNTVEVYRAPNFVDALLSPVAAGGQSEVTRTITLPTDLDMNSVTAAYLVNNLWYSPYIAVNDNAGFSAFQGSEDVWTTSVRQLTVSHLKPGANQIRYSYNGSSLAYGQFVENPGPMLVIHRTAPGTTTNVTSGPQSLSVNEGQPATFSVTASGATPLSYQWNRNGTPISGAINSSYTIAQATQADHGATFTVTVSGPGGSDTSDPATLTVVPVGGAVGPWWNTTWDYRMPVNVDAGPYARSNRIVEQNFDFTQLMLTAGQGGVTFDPNTLRIVEVDTAGNVIDADVPIQWEPTTDFNPQTRATGTVVWMMEGSTPAFAVRRYHLYFDRTGKGIAAPTVANQVTLTQNVMDAGFNSHRIQTQLGDWYYHTAGGGFSSLIDPQGNDWLSYSTTLTPTGASGDYRGVPNAVPPGGGGFFHPGRTTSTTSILNSGPLRVTLQSTSNTNGYISKWHIYPSYATMQMTKADGSYWILYEGTPGGAVNGTTDTVVRPDGTVTTAATSWTGDIAGEEWVYFTDQATNRSFFAANSANDGHVDSYYLMNNAMTVFGFGRNGTNTNASLKDTSAIYTVGLLNSTNFATNKAAILSASRPVGVSSGTPAYDGSFSGPYTDPFSLPTLDPRWTITDPRGTSTVSLNGEELVISTPGGPTTDLWTNRNWAPRVLQPTPNADFDIVVKVEDLNTVATTMQGVLVQQDDNDLLRFNLAYTNNALRVQGVTMVNGTGSTRFSSAITPTSGPIWLRVIRSGNNWTLRWSTNGINYTTAGNVTNFVLNVTSSGVFIGSHGTNNSNAQPYSARFDYYQNLGQPVNPADVPVISNVAVDPTARTAVVTFTTNETADGYVDYGLTAALGSSATGGTDLTSHTVVISPLACNQTYFFQPRAIDTTLLTGTGSVASFSTDPCPTFQSDDFSPETTLDPVWQYRNPLNDSTLSLTGTQAVISVPAGTPHDLWTSGLKVPRLVQEAPSGDFEIETKFETNLTSRYQSLGTIVELDGNDYLRFEVYHTGTEWRVFAGNMAEGVKTTAADVAFTPGVATWIRVGKAGTVWTMKVSNNGTDWTTIGTITRGLDPAFVGSYVGTTHETPSSSPSLTGTIDYIFNTASPIDPEDGGGGGDTTGPVISNVVVNVSPQSATVSWTTDEPATGSVNYGLTTAYGVTQSAPATLVTNRTITLPLLLCGKTLNYRVRSTDAAGNETVGPNATFNTAACPTAVVSDDFSQPAIDARWAVRNPVGTPTVTLLTGTALRFNIPIATPTDITVGGNNGVRLLQAFNNSDFSAEAKWESPVAAKFQIQGLVVEQDDNTLIRFDMSWDGTAVKGFVGKRTSSTLSNLAYANLPAGTTALRVARTGTTWTFSSSVDGTTYTPFHSMTDTMQANRLGPWAGTAKPSANGTAPAFTSQVDYFFNTASPIVPEDGGGTGANPTQFNLFYGDNQTFGNIGKPTPWVNIMGTVSDVEGVSQLFYTVNGSQQAALTIGPDTRRLVGPGSFNADIPRTALQNGANTILLRAVDGQGNVTTKTVTVNYSSANTWPLPYTANWSTAGGNIQNVVEAVDGNWGISGGNLVNLDRGYDRLVAIGDSTWTDYEVVVPVTINTVDQVGGDPFPSLGPLFGVIQHWNGHYANGAQPNWAFTPIGGFGMYHWLPNSTSEGLRFMDSGGTYRAIDQTQVWQVGVPYYFKMQVQNGGTGPTYKLKFWPQANTEPAGWMISYTDGPTTPTSGSLLLVAHHVDAVIGNVTVTPLAAAQAAAPVITPNGGSFTGVASNVTMSTTTPGAVIRYTVDGNEPTAASTQYTGPINVTYTATIKAKAFAAGMADSTTTSATFTITPSGRTLTNIEAIYDFADGSGATVADGSGLPDLNPLTIANTGNVTWLSGGLAINASTTITTASGASRVVSDIQAANEFTMEMWIKPANNTQSGPAQIFSISSSTSNRNVVVSQTGATYTGQVRVSPQTGAGTATQMSSATIGASPVLDHVVVTRSSSGLVTWYLNGTAMGTTSMSGNLSTWANMKISIGNETGGTRPWLGEIHYAAIYSRALTAGEVTGNYGAGSSL